MLNYTNRFLESVTLLAEMLFPDGDSFYLLGNYISMAAIHVTQSDRLIRLERNANVTNKYPMTFTLEATESKFWVNSGVFVLVGSGKYERMWLD